MNEKAKWEKPKLIILTRGKPEERVLIGCKQVGNPASSGGLDNQCANATCTECHTPETT